MRSQRRQRSYCESERREGRVLAKFKWNRKEPLNCAKPGASVLMLRK